MFDFEETQDAASVQSLLAVSGGGLLGVVPAAMMMRYETLGREAYGPDYRLCDSFHTVTGTSTGAVIAAGIALGLSAQDIANFYLQDVPRGFKRRALAVPLWQDVFDGDLMEGFFEARTQGRLLERSALNCDLTILTKDVTRGKSVAFTTVAKGKDSILGAEIRREALPLARLLRASTAAPGLFSPVEIDLAGLGKATLADGGFSLFNDPSFLAARLAMSAGASQIEMTSLGTGSSRPTYTARRPRMAILRAMKLLFGMIKDGEAFTDGMMIELADAHGDNMLYRRHDMSLSRAAFDDLGFATTQQEVRHMRNFMDYRGKERLYEAATLLAEKTINTALPLAVGKEMLHGSGTSDRMG